MASFIGYWIRAPSRCFLLGAVIGVIDARSGAPRLKNKTPKPAANRLASPSLKQDLAAWRQQHCAFLHHPRQFSIYFNG